ncbi:MAG: hypothetical protein Q4G22_12570 [Paracoccus sp. (in: a-proteobacteria)]|uniref:hypothetical protein n=1 Tax=Paracoccus sp. TaxID=267 RepID=UPI0026E0F3C4|nr:hypothetical protein [Paracoccus sp. (in: a-proteobacteria)]MDO5632652.1 hypothetical protein [Paracoccus sp. (in: a-proteobacteria)]
MLAGCGSDAGDGLATRPAAKPEVLTAQLANPGAAKGQGPLTRAQVSTKSGEILILEPDGSVTTMRLDSPGGRDAFAVTQADLAAVSRVGAEAIMAAPAVMRASHRGPTAQQVALDEFAQRTRPALPEWRAGTEIDPSVFLGSMISGLSPESRSDLVEVTVNLRQGVDADIAFSYATCALAGWAKSNGAGYARHIRTLQQQRDGKLLVGAAFTLSKTRPMGLRVMETNETLRECRARGIPAA